ncbi:hypothetical protein, conserved [Eimeria acervulina]|uniref:Uncharacterized protein n=1 Tax=Eimeria acervulina TaxID=5801 RepID=U6GFT2_EIMAC|nr:hypothetical protein, conserved [Eimeria acervulina]CDI78442.1 hypothetical protein, conserved [Eimeria acervulina]
MPAAAAATAAATATATAAAAAAATAAAAAAEDLLEEWEDAVRGGDVSGYLNVLEKIKQLQQQLQQQQQQVLLLPDDVNFKDERGNTALHYAAANGHLQLVQLLLQRGARLERNSSGNTALHWLVLNKQRGVLQLLLQEEDRQRSCCSVHKRHSQKPSEAAAAAAAAADKSAATNATIAAGRAAAGDVAATSASTAEEGAAAAAAAAATAAGATAAACSCVLRIDVLQQNDFGRSALSEGFAAADAEMLQLLLEHHSAEELEKQPLVSKEPEAAAAAATATATGAAASGAGPQMRQKQQQQHKQKQQPQQQQAASSAVRSSTTHLLQFEQQIVKCREIALDWEGEVFSTHQQASTDDTTGVALWGSAVVGARWLHDVAKQSPEVFAGKTVLELGAGCGLLGLCCSLLQHSPVSVVLSDVFPHTLNNLVHNCTINNITLKQQQQQQQQQQQRAEVEVVRLDCCDPKTFPTDEQGSIRRFDVIVGSDLLYDVSALKNLVMSICCLLKPKTGRLYYTHKLSRDGAPLLADALRQAGLKVEELGAPDEYLSNCLLDKSNSEFYAVFNELEGENDFVLLRAAWR